ncbi:hypothetical protein [Rugamonas sp.]|uniref:hypothetical protein n=1 Tax=Rugamonas sp. TaxID=1926287 RepID=UPI0025DCE4A0|nr:hypothetical protein [Rugamonas sp.]
MKLPTPGARYELLVARRNEKMARSPQSYVRGNTTRYYDWFPHLNVTSVAEEGKSWFGFRSEVPFDEGDNLLFRRAANWAAESARAGNGPTQGVLAVETKTPTCMGWRSL